MAWTSADLDAIDDAIKAKMTGGAVQSYSIGDRNVTHMRVDELMRLRRDVASLVSESSASSSVVMARLRPR